MPADTDLPLPGVHNIRDLGGLPIASGGRTAYGRMLRACAMRGLAREGQKALIEAGLATVIDLRSQAERTEAPGPFSGMTGIADFHLPLFANLAPLGQDARPSSPVSLKGLYATALEKAAPRFAEAVVLIADSAPGLVIFHCTAGKDRTGLLAAMLLSLAGVSRADIVADYSRTASDGAALLQRLRDDARGRGAEASLIETLLGVPSAAMSATLALLDGAYGGARPYLRASGLTGDQIDRAAARLLPAPA